jgi:uncharacterized protein (TIGR02996 family)
VGEERDRLLAAIVADPDVLVNWVVYADWLLERGDPRGELINLELAIEAGATDDRVERHRALQRDEDALVSPRLLEEVHHFHLTWWRGFIKEAEMFGPADDVPTRETLAALIADPHACLLRTLSLADPVPVFGDLRCETVRELYFICYVAVKLPLAEVFPRLDRLVLGFCPDWPDPDYSTRLERIVHPTLTSIRGLCPALASGAFELPSLTELQIGDPIPLLGPNGILTRPPTKLVTLGAEVTAESLRALRQAPIFSQLRALSVPAEMEVIEELAAAPSAFEHIALSCVACVDTMEERDALATQIAALLPEATISIEVADPPPNRPALPLAPIGDALTKLAQRLRDRNS